MDAQSSSRSDRLIVFGRYPVPGRTKTRLIPDLGPAGAAELQKQLTEKIFRTAKAFASKQKLEMQVCYESGSGKKIRRWLGTGAHFSMQKPGDLGARMEAAFHDAFQGGCRRVVLVGTDVPESTVRHLEEAFDALKEKDLVLGPSADGGYWLVGLKGSAPIFRNMPWGTPEVFGKTLSVARHQALSIHCLDPIGDVDTPEDLEKRLPEWKRPYISVIIPALDEAEVIESTMDHARSDDAEIIVVDGGSRDETVVRARQSGARILERPRGRAVQQNRGASVAEGRVLLFLHADTRLPEDYVLQVFDTLMDPSIILGAFRFRTDLKSSPIRLIEILTNFRSQFLRLPYGDQAFFVRKPVFHAFGGFPEVPIAEDLLFVRKLSKHGRIRMAPGAAVTSARRWRSIGTLRTLMINQVILVGLALRISPHVLATLYRHPARGVKP